MDKKGTFHLNDAKLTAYSHGTYFELGEALGTFGFSVRKDKKNTKDVKNAKDAKNTKGTKAIKNAKNAKDAKDKRDIRMSSGKNGSEKPDFRKPAKKYADRRKH